jgi:hypothetical protein
MSRPPVPLELIRIPATLGLAFLLQFVVRPRELLLTHQAARVGRGNEIDLRVPVVEVDVEE